MKKILILTIAALFSINSYSQGKFGHINTQEIMQLMPETKNITEELQKFQKSLESQIQSMEMELQQNLQEYQDNLATYSDLVKQDKEAELQSIQQRMQTFAQDAQQAINKKEMELLTPLKEKVLKAITDVATEGNYTYIFDKNLSGILYANESENIIDKVKKKLDL
tara:strand:+ start:136 stop:633 length:498 start_codon:yes stop_codon:yes gene_type:complete